jgi:hypothetical protein
MRSNCTCGLAMRMNSTIAAMALGELRKHDPKAADRIIAAANSKAHADWCGSATKWLKQRKGK